MKKYNQGLKIALYCVIGCLFSFGLTACGGLSSCGGLNSCAGSCNGIILDCGGSKQPQSYTITYNVNGGSAIEREIYEGNEIPEKPDDPVKVGYAFLGWYLDLEGRQEYKFDAPLTADLTVYAQYEEKFYTVSYVTNAETEIESEVCKWNALPQMPDSPTKEGYTFLGWYFDEELKQKYSYDVALNADVTLYASFMEGIAVYTRGDLENISEQPSEKYILMNDIDLASESWTPLESFSGELNGDGYTIKNLTLSTTGNVSGFIKENTGTIKNLTFENVSFTATCDETFNAGTIVGKNIGTVENVSVKNLVMNLKDEITKHEGNFVDVGSTNYHCYMYRSFTGGVIGWNTESGSVLNCSAQGNVFAIVKPFQYDSSTKTHNELYMGGAVGKNYGTVKSTVAKVDFETVAISEEELFGSTLAIGGVIAQNHNIVEKCGYEGDISISAQGEGTLYAFVGGFVEYALEGTINQCYAKGNIIDDSGKFDHIVGGGFTWNNGEDASIVNCYANVNIETASLGGEWDGIGGFIGEHYGVIEKCYANGNIVTNAIGEIGGFVGIGCEGSILRNSFSSGNISYVEVKKIGAFIADFGNCTLEKVYYNQDMQIIVNGAEDSYTESNSRVGKVVATKIFTTEFLVDELAFNETLWTIDGENAPKLAWEKATV